MVLRRGLVVALGVTVIVVAVLVATSRTERRGDRRATLVLMALVFEAVHRDRPGPIGLSRDYLDQSVAGYSTDQFTTFSFVDLNQATPSDAKELAKIQIRWNEEHEPSSWFAIAHLPGGVTYYYDSDGNRKPYLVERVNSTTLLKELKILGHSR